MPYSKLLIDAFGGGPLKDIAEIVKEFDFSKITIENDTSYLHTSLAPSFGEIDNAAIQKMDDYVRVMITGLMHALSKILGEERSWDNILSSILQNPLLQADPESIVSRMDNFDNIGTYEFRLPGGVPDPDENIVKKVNEWFKKLISDDKVQKATNLDIDTLARIVLRAGVTIDSIEAFFDKTERHSKTMVDIGVLQFPSIKQPYFQMYRIQLHAWSDCTRRVFVEWDANGIEGSYYSRKFIPNSSVIDDLKEETRKKAIDEADHLFVAE